MATKALTGKDAVLRALGRLQRESGGALVPAAELVLVAWRMDRAALGLEGHESDHPDANKVLSMLMGKHGLVARGLVERPAPKRYGLTSAGAAMEAATRRPPRAASSRRRPAALPDEERISLLLSSPAMAKWAAGDRHGIQFTDACAFWGIAAGGDRAAVDRAIDSTASLLERVLRCGDAAGWETEGGRRVARDDLEVALELHRWMEERFSSHLTLLRSRSASRGRAG